MQLISKLNEGVRFSVYVIDIYSKYAWIVRLKEKKGVTVINAFKNLLNQSGRKETKIWVVE